jgi:2-amino-4-hydroxy-6-hydroxymethyldihydropteridine diphosphokinase
MADAYVAAGSNVRPRASLTEALRLLRRGFPGLRVSRAYSNAAVGFEGDDFINLVVAFPADLPTEALLDRLKAVERACGREPGAPKWGPANPRPRPPAARRSRRPFRRQGTAAPGLLTRAWVLGPLAELAPAVVHPVAGERIDALWRRFDQRAHPLAAGIARRRGWMKRLAILAADEASRRPRRAPRP